MQTAIIPKEYKYRPSDEKDNYEGLSHYEKVMKAIDLYKPIEFESRTFVPLIELAKIHFDGMYDDLIYTMEPSTNGGFVHVTRKNKRGWDFAFSQYMAQGSFRLQMNGSDCVINQLELFAKLYEWGFDISIILQKRKKVE